MINTNLQINSVSQCRFFGKTSQIFFIDFNPIQVTLTARNRNQASKRTRGWLGGNGGTQTDLRRWYGPGRVLYLPEGLILRSEIPSYLNGQLAGDYGFDPLSLGRETKNLSKFREAEMIHARWAMLATLGILIPEGLESNGADIVGGTWYETGAKMLNGGQLNYFAVPWAVIKNPIPLVAVIAIEIVAMFNVENYRRTRRGPSGYSPGIGKFDSSIFTGLDYIYPGGPFDPLALSEDPDNFSELKVKEIKNGRLALVSVLGYAFQCVVTGEGPYTNWIKHISDPFGYNFVTILTSEDRIPVL